MIIEFLTIRLHLPYDILRLEEDGGSKWMSIKSLTRLVTGAISIPLLILFSHEGLQAQTDPECDRSIIVSAILRQICSKPLINFIKLI